MARPSQGGRQRAAVANDRDPQAAGYERLVVECSGCRQSNHIPLELIKRPPETPLADLAERLVCKRCGKTGPLPQITGVSRQLNGVGVRYARAPRRSDPR